MMVMDLQSLREARAIDSPFAISVRSPSAQMRSDKMAASDLAMILNHFLRLSSELTERHGWEERRRTRARQ